MVKLGGANEKDGRAEADVWHPPYCYVHAGILKFNSAGTNTGGCTNGTFVQLMFGFQGASNECICWANGRRWADPRTAHSAELPVREGDKAQKRAGLLLGLHVIEL